MKADKNLIIKEKIIEFLERFPFYKYAAKANFITEETLKTWRDEDEDFSYKCEAARTNGVLMYGRRASPEFMLSHTDKETFGNKTEVDVTSKGEKIEGLIVISHENTSVPVANECTKEQQEV